MSWYRIRCSVRKSWFLMRYLTNRSHLLAISGAELADVVYKKYGTIDYEWGISSASTDFVSLFLLSFLLRLTLCSVGKCHLSYGAFLH